jgi:hypothetical protein
MNKRVHGWGFPHLELVCCQSDFETTRLCGIMRTFTFTSALIIRAFQTPQSQIHILALGI